MLFIEHHARFSGGNHRRTKGTGHICWVNQVKREMKVNAGAGCFVPLGSGDGRSPVKPQMPRRRLPLHHALCCWTLGSWRSSVKPRTLPRCLPSGLPLARDYLPHLHPRPPAMLPTRSSAVRELLPLWAARGLPAGGTVSPKPRPPEAPLPRRPACRGSARLQPGRVTRCPLVSIAPVSPGPWHQPAHCGVIMGVPCPPLQRGCALL